MTDITLETIGSGYNLSNINTNFQRISQAINEEILHNTGGNNVMGQPIDLNGNEIYNLASPTTLNSAARWIDVIDAVDLTGEAVPSQSGNEGKVLGTNGTNLSWVSQRENQEVIDYDGLRGLTSSGLTDGNKIWVEGFAEAWEVKTGAVTDNGGSLLVFDDDANRYAESTAKVIDVEMFDAPRDSDATAQFQAAVDYVTNNGKKLVAHGTYNVIDGPINVDYQSGQISTSVPQVFDFGNARLIHTGTGYLWNFTEGGNSSGRPRLYIYLGRQSGSSSATGGILINGQGGMSFFNCQFDGYTTGIPAVHLYNNVSGDYAENVSFDNVRSTCSGDLFRFEQGVGTGSFARFRASNVFIGSSHDNVFNVVSGSVYNSIFDNIKGNPGSSTIFNLTGGMGGSVISGINLEQSGASGICFDVSRGFSGSEPCIDFTGFFYDGSGSIWDFGATGLTESNFAPTGGASIKTQSNLQFPATPVLSDDVNTMDRYEEGVWTPVFEPETNSFTSITYDANAGGLYTVIGNVCHIQGFIATDDLTVGTATGDLDISGLPFTSRDTSSNAGTGCIHVGTSANFGTNHPMEGIIIKNSNVISLKYRTTSSAASSDLQVSDMGTGANNNQIYFAGWYEID